MLDLSQAFQSDSVEFGARVERSNKEYIFGMSEQSQKQISEDVCISSHW